MMFLTQANRKALPPLYSTESVPATEKVAPVKFFHPCGRWTFYAVEFDGDDTFFGYCVSAAGPDCDEWGYSSLSELQAVRGPMGLGIERDLHWKPGRIPCLNPESRTLTR
jgi:hypothetical protein